MEFYFDHLKASKPDLEIATEMSSHKNFWASVNGSHKLSQEVSALNEEARAQISRRLNIDSEHILFLDGLFQSIDFALWEKKPTEIISLGFITPEEHDFLVSKSELLNITYQYTPLEFDKNEVLNFLQNRKNVFIYVHHFSLLAFKFFPVKQASKLLHENNSFLFLNSSETIGKIKIDCNHLPVDFIFASGQLIKAPRFSAIAIIKSKNLLRKIRQFENPLVYNNLFFDKALEKSLTKQNFQSILNKLYQKLSDLHLENIKLFYNEQIPFYLKIELPKFDSFSYQSLEVKFDMENIAASFIHFNQKDSFAVLFTQLGEIQNENLFIDKSLRLIKWYMSNK